MVQWSVPALLGELPGVLGRIRALLAGRGAHQAQIEAVESAVREAFARVVLGARTSERGVVTVGCWLDDKHGEAFVRLASQGARHDPTGAGPNAPAQPGVYLIKTHMDQVKYEYVHGTNMLTMRKQLGTD